MTRLFGEPAEDEPVRTPATIDDLVRRMWAILDEDVLLSTVDGRRAVVVLARDDGRRLLDVVDRRGRWVVEDDGRHWHDCAQGDVDGVVEWVAEWLAVSR